MNPIHLQDDTFFYQVITEYMLGMLLLRKCHFKSLPLGARFVSYIKQLLVTELPHTDQFDGCSI